MADRYDPKLSVRPPGERKTAEPQADSDPLAELARIVSGRSPIEPAPTAKGKAIAAAPQPEPDVERDLEAELLNDLQASFAAIREPLENASAAAPTPDPEPEPASLPQSPIRAAPEPEVPRAPEPEPPPRRSEPLSFDISQAFEEGEFAPRPKAPPRPEVAKSYTAPLRGPAAPQNRGDLPVRPPAPPRAALPVRADPVPPAREPVQPHLDRPTPAPAGPDRPSLLRRVVGPSRNERPGLPVRPLSGKEEPRDVEPAVPAKVGAPRPGRVESAPLPSRFAPPPRAAAPAPPRRPPPPEPAVEPPPADDFDLADLAGELEGPFEDEFTLDDLDAYGPDDEFPPFPEEELANLKRRRSGRVFAVIAGMLAIVAIGGAAVFLYRGDSASNSPPPIIVAEAGPTKVPPDEQAVAETDAQGKLIYDRVDESGDETRLVTSGEAAVGEIPADDVDDNPISRVIIPGGPGIDGPAPVGEAGAAVIAEVEPPGSEDAGIGPRMVRTVVVKPDGTIVSSAATGVDEDGNALPQPEETDVAVMLPEPGRSEMDAVLEGGDLAVNPDPLSQTTRGGNPPGSATANFASEDEPIPEPPAALRTLPSPQPEPVEPVAVAPEPAAPPPARQEQTIVATRDSANGPIDLTPGTAPAGGAVQNSGGGVLVQVSAQRSEEAAASAYRGLQQRYPSILGSFQPTIVRADLGERGVYYRVRVGPFSSGDATRLCEDLKAAGGECILAR